MYSVIIKTPLVHNDDPTPINILFGFLFGQYIPLDCNQHLCIKVQYLEHGIRNFICKQIIVIIYKYHY